MPDAYSEDQLVERPALQLLAELGWSTVSAREEVFGPGGTLGRETSGDAVLLPRLRAALARLNPGLPPEALAHAADELTRDRSGMSAAAANRETYALLKDGVPISVPDREHGGQRDDRVRAVDWRTPAANDFLAVSHLSVTGALYARRPDVVGFVNGLPLVVLEFKKPGVPPRAAFDDNLATYKADVPQLFWHNALLGVSNGTDSRVGSLTADWERFFEWKRVAREDEPRRVSLEVMLRGTCEPARLLDLAENFTLFSEHQAGLVKILGQNHQVLGVNNAIAAMLSARAAGDRRGGVFWQTQGSGKSYAMVFFAQKVLRTEPGNWTFVIVTDRRELDDQIARTFKAVGAVDEAESSAVHAGSGAELRALLRGNHRYVFTLIHKFQTAEALSERADVVVLADEAHPSQYDTLAVHMRAALPGATFVAFTGTPLMAGEERTKAIFGDYVSVYDFQQSVEDGATVKLFYENRTPELRLDNPALNDDIYALIEAAELDEGQERRLERELGRRYHLITRDDRLETVARDVVDHFLGRGFQGKAMVVSIDKPTAVRMYDKVRAHSAAERARVEGRLASLTQYPPGDGGEVRELRRRLDVLDRTDMAVVVSSEQNEGARMAALGLDIAPHRRRMHDEDLAEAFKDPDHPLALVFVCAMWLTGFDAPSCSTVYLDKPMRNHTLMQTIARANRVFPGKHSGLIVDYANVFESLERALAVYGAGRGGATPVHDKRELAAELRSAVDAALAHCAARGVDLGAIEATPAGSLDRLTRIAAAVDALISPDPARAEFLARERWVRTIADALKPDPAVLEFGATLAALATIAAVIRERTGEGGASTIAGVMGAINKLLDVSIAADGFRIGEGRGGRPLDLIDLSALDFEALARRFASSNTPHVALEQLKAAIRGQLGRMIQVNRSRADYLAKFEMLVDSYNAGSRGIEELFEELLALSRALSDEQQRHVREQLTEDELTVFDILTRPGPDLSPVEREEVKKVARLLLQRVQGAVVLSWRQKAAARARVRIAIEDALDEGLPRAYTPELYRGKVAAVFEHVYERFRGADPPPPPGRAAA